MRQFLLHQPYKVIMLGSFGGLLGVLLVYFDSKSTQESVAYTNTPEFVVWLFLIFVIFALYAIIAIPLWRNVTYYKIYLRKNRSLILPLLIVILLFFVPDVFARTTYFSDLTFPLAHQEDKIFLVLLLGVICVTIPSVLTMWLIQIAAREELPKEDFTTHHIERYLQMRDNLTIIMLIQGSMIGLAILSAAALRQSLIAVSVVPINAFPTLLTLMYGAFFTFFLTAMYLPAYLTLLEIGQKMRDTLYALPHPTDASWHDVLSNRKEFEDLLQLKTTDYQNIQANFAVLVPLFSGIVSILLAK